MRRIAVTGLGLVTPVGHTVDEAWENIVAGRSGVSVIDAFDASGFASRIGATVRNFDLSPYMSPKEARKTDQFIHYGIAAAKQAVADAGLDVTEENRERIGIAIGSGIGGLPGIEKGHDGYLAGGPRKISPFFVPANIINMIAGNLSIELGIRGPNYGIVTACSTGTHNIGDAARMIERGDVDVMIAGGAEMATSPMGLGGFSSARALSTRNDDPEGASRPWDKGRDGFVLGDGAGVVVLESWEHATARGATIYAEFAGFGMSSDAWHITLPPDDGDGAPNTGWQSRRGTPSGPVRMGRSGCTAVMGGREQRTTPRAQDRRGPVRAAGMAHRPAAAARMAHSAAGPRTGPWPSEP